MKLSASRRKRLFQVVGQPLFWGGVTLGVALLLMVPWAYPGSGAALADGLLAEQVNPQLCVRYPVAFFCLRAVAPLLSIGVLNVLTAVASALVVGLLLTLLRGFIEAVSSDPRSRFAQAQAQGVGVAIGGLVCLSAPTFLHAASHFQWTTFELMLLLLLGLMLGAVIKGSNFLKRSTFGLLTGVLLLASPTTLIAGAVLLLTAMAFDLLQAKRFTLIRSILRFALPALLGIGILLAGTFYLCGSFAFHSLVAVRLGELRQCFAGPWIVVAFFGFTPFLLALLGLPKVCANSRTFSVLFVYLTTLVLLLLAALPIGLSPFVALGDWGEVYPLLFALMMAFAAGMAAAATVYLLRVKVPPEGVRERVGLRKGGAFLALLIPVPLGLALLIAHGVTFGVKVAAERPLLAQVKPFTALFLTERKGEQWVLGDGQFDTLVRLYLAGEPREGLTFIPLAQADAPATVEGLRRALRTAETFKHNPALSDALGRALDIGFYPFAQDWMMLDIASATQHFRTLANPNLWYAGNALPLPQRYAFRGVPTEEALKQMLSPATLQAFLPEELPACITDKALSDKLSYGLKAWCSHLALHDSLIRNNLAFHLSQLGYKAEAYALFKAAYKQTGENVSALLNCFSLINAGICMEDRAWCEKELAAHSKRLSRAQPENAYGFLLDARMALIFNQQQAERHLAAQRASAAFRLSPSNTLAELREAARRALQANDFVTAEKILAHAKATLPNPAEMAYEEALLHASQGHPDKARQALRTYVALYPKSLEANAMLATLQLEADELDELRRMTLPKLTTAAGTRDNYYVQIILAQLADKEGKLKEARTAYSAAYRLNPSVTALRNTILQRDIQLADRPSALRHAKDFLLRDRNHPLSNYVMGSLALSDGDLQRALSYLTVATAPNATPPIPEAYNDLAETYRRLSDWDNALSAAQQATRLAPKLAIAHETMGAALLELGRFNEAHQALNRAEEVHKALLPDTPIDPRILITRARLHLKEKQPELARVILVDVRQSAETLEPSAKAELDALEAALRE